MGRHAAAGAPLMYRRGMQKMVGLAHLPLEADVVRQRPLKLDIAITHRLDLRPRQEGRAARRGMASGPPLLALRHRLHGC